MAEAPQSGFKHRVRAFGATVKHGAQRVGRWPWARIGLWTGGVVGGLVALLIITVALIDWNAFKGPITRMASAATGREIQISGDLNVHPWSLTPELTVTGLKIGNPGRYRERGNFADVEHAVAAVRLLPLLVGRFDIVRLDLDGAKVELYRSAEGDGNWSPDPTVGRGKPLNLPAIRRFSIKDGRMRFVDERREMVLDANFTSRESAQRTDPGEFALNGDGTINGRRFTIELTGAALINVRRDRPYAFNADVRAGPTRLTAEGAIARPFDLSQWHANVHASGSDLADLYYLLGLALPNTPPYRLAGNVVRNGARYEMTGLAGRVGDSDLAGRFAVTHHDDRPFLEGNFRTRSLDFDDLLAVLGGAPSTARGETASPEQRVEAQRLAAQGRILPDARLDIRRVRNMDARVHYAADRVRTDKLPLRGVALDVSLDHGLLRLDPMTLSLVRGRVNGSVAINARQETPQVDLDARLTNARIEDILAMRGRPAMTGPLFARVRLSGRGAAVREAAAHANGAVSFMTPHGEVREAFAELTGINVTRGLGLLLAHDEGKIDVRCGVAHFQVHDGIMTADRVVFDTETMLIHGEGTVSLRDETFDMQLQGKPKEPRLIRVSAPITLRGRLRDPTLGVSVGRVAGQAGIAAVLSTLVAPLASVLPFIDVGLADDADCRQLVAEANTPAPRASTRAPARRS